MHFKQITWNVAYRQCPAGTILQQKKTAQYTWRVIPNPIGKWAADPFVIEHQDKIFIFAELFDVMHWRGEIGYCIFQGNTFSSWKTALKLQSHLSFPYLFQDNSGNIYMMPETGSTKTITLWKSQHFPDSWEKYIDIATGEKFVDSIFVEHDKLLSYCLKRGEVNKVMLLSGGNNGNGFAFKVVQHWEDKEDIRRPAGKILYFDGKQLRPAQIGKVRYGGGICFVKQNFSREGLLTEEHFQDIDLNDIHCENFSYPIVGCHTYNSIANMEIIDIQYERFNLLDLAKRVSFKLLPKTRQIRENES